MKSKSIAPMLAILVLTMLLFACKGSSPGTAEQSASGFVSLKTDSSLVVKSMELNKKSYVSGDDLVLKIKFEGLEEGSSAWVGIIPSDVEHGDEAFNDEHDITYSYLSEISDGKVTFSLAGDGKFDIRVFDNDDGGVEVAYLSFTVGSGSGGDEASSVGAKSVLESRTFKLFGSTLNPEKNPVRMVYRLSYEGEPFEVTVAIKDSSIYTSYSFDGTEIASLMLDDVTYQILHDQRTIIKASASEIPVPKMPDEEHLEDAEFSIGEETVNDTIFDAERFTSSDGSESCFCYEKGSGRLCYIYSGSGEYVELVEYDNSVKDEWFVLPEGYGIVDMQQTNN